MNLNDAVQKIKKAGTAKVRIIPMSGSNINTGDYQIEVLEESSWHPILSGIKKQMAEDLVAQATNRVICG